MSEEKSIEVLKQKLSNPKLDIYTCFVMARRDLEAGNVEYALNRIRVDLDKLICEDRQFYTYLTDIWGL